MCLFDPQYNLNDQSDEYYGVGFTCQVLHKLEVKGDLLAAVVTDGVYREFLKYRGEER
jgi:hypothetical protein